MPNLTYQLKVCYNPAMSPEEVTKVNLKELIGQIGPAVLIFVDDNATVLTAAAKLHEVITTPVFTFQAVTSLYTCDENGLPVNGGFDELYELVIALIKKNLRRKVVVFMDGDLGPSSAAERLAQQACGDRPDNLRRGTVWIKKLRYGLEQRGDEQYGVIFIAHTSNSDEMIKYNFTRAGATDVAPYKLGNPHTGESFVDYLVNEIGCPKITG